jgi:4-amino-4-deoxy-L-arabinose transferase-like glycosyltransferase
MAQGAEDPADRRRPSFFALLAAVVALGIVARVIYIEVVSVSQFADTSWYLVQSANLKRGIGYVDPARQYAALHGHPEYAGLVPTAYWPPLYSMFLAGVRTVIGDSTRTLQLAGVATGAATIGLTGVLGRAVAGWRVGLVAALIVALSPFVIAVDGSLLSETLYVPLVLLALLFAHRARNHPTAWSWSILGLMIGLATLTRSDALALLAFVFVPAALLARDPARHLLPRVALGVAVCALTLAPWAIRNTIEVGEPTISTVSASGVIAGSNCPYTYEGSGLGYWRYSCMQPQLGFTMDEVDYAAKMRSKGARFALEHADRLPVVGAARLARVWGLWNPTDLTRREAIESRNLRWQQIAWTSSMVMLVFAVVGFSVLVKRRQQIAVLLGPVLMTTTLAIATYGNTRFRAATEPVLAIAAAVAVVYLWTRVRTELRPPIRPGALVTPDQPR